MTSKEVIRVKRTKDEQTLTSFGPVVASTTLAENEVVRAEKVAQRPRSNRVHRSWLKVNQDCTWNVLVRADLVIVDRDALKLKIVVALVQTIPLNTMLIRNDLPELGTCGRKDMLISGMVKNGRNRYTPIWLPHCGRESKKAMRNVESTSNIQNIPGQSEGGRFHACYEDKVSTSEFIRRSGTTRQRAK